MTSLLDKLNVLVKSSLNSFLGDAAGASHVPAERLGKDIDGEVARLRQQIDAALNQEDAMQKRLEQVQQQIDSYDQQADAALQRNDEGNARYLVQQMQRQQQLASMMQAELDQHRRATSEFIERVNVLEATVSDARHQQAVGQAPGQTPAAAPDEDTESRSERVPGAVLSDLLRDARERVENILESTSGHAQPSAPDGAPDPGQQHIPVTTQPADAVQPQPADAQPDTQTTMRSSTPGNEQVEADLARRRARLSKPD
jgi:phage shock protein A